MAAHCLVKAAFTIIIGVITLVIVMLIHSWSVLKDLLNVLGHSESSPLLYFLSYLFSSDANDSWVRVSSY